MVVGKNKGLSKGKKGKKKTADPFLRKEWYDVKAPSMFTKRVACQTLVNRTQGTKVASDSLKDRVYEVSLADLNDDVDQGFRKIKLQCQDISGRACLTNFYGMDMTRDKLCSLVRKWHSLIEARADVKTADGYVLRMFCLAFTAKQQNQVKKTSYAQASQIRAIRKKMVDIMTREASSCDLKELVAKFIPESIGKEIEKACQSVYPLQNVYIRKVKMLKAPKFDVVKLAELHAGGDLVVEEGEDVDGDEEEEVEEEEAEEDE